MTPRLVLPEPPQLPAIPAATPLLATARFADPAALESDLFSYCPGKICFGAINGRLTGFIDDTHVLVVAGTRSSKTAALSNFLHDWPGSLFHSTSKGNEASRLAHRRGPGNEYCDGLGQIVGIADPHGITVGVDEFKISVNPFDVLTADDPNCIAVAYRLAICVIPLRNGEGASDYFANDARLCLVVVMLFVKFSPFYADRRNLSTVQRLILEGDIETFNDLKSQHLLELDDQGRPIDTPFTVLWKGIATCTALDGLVERHGAYFNEMRSLASKQFIGVKGELVTALSFMNDPGMATLFSRTTFNMADLKFHPRGASLFVCLEPSKSESAAAARRLLYSLAEEAMKRPGRPATGHMTLGHLDEFAGMGRLDTVLNNMAEIAGYGMKLVIVVQTLAQLADEKRYGEKGLEVFFSGCCTRIYADIRTLYDAQIISKFAGEREVVAVNRTLAASSGTSVSTATGVNTSQSVNYSDTQGTSDGGQRSLSNNESRTFSHSYGAGVLEYLLPNKLLMALLVFRRQWTRSVGRQSSVGATEGRQWGSSQSRTVGGGRTSGNSTTDTEGANEGLTATIAENRQVRPLLAIHEIVNRYSKHTLDGAPLALVEVCGPGFFEVERIRYYQHEAFYRKFGRDPDFDFVQAPKPAAVLQQEQRERDYAERTSPAAVAALQAEASTLRSAVDDYEEKSLLLHGLHIVSVLGTFAFIAVGGWLAAPLPAAGWLVCSRIKRQWRSKRQRLKDLAQELEESRKRR